MRDTVRVNSEVPKAIGGSIDNGRDETAVDCLRGVENQGVVHNHAPFTENIQRQVFQKII